MPEHVAVTAERIRWTSMVDGRLGFRVESFWGGVDQEACWRSQGSPMAKGQGVDGEKCETKNRYVFSPRHCGLGRCLTFRGWRLPRDVVTPLVKLTKGNP